MKLSIILTYYRRNKITHWCSSVFQEIFYL